MSKKEFNRKHIEAFFYGAKSNILLKAGIVVAVIGFLLLLGDGGSVIAAGLLTAAAGIAGVIIHFKTPTPQEKYYSEVNRAKRYYLNQLLNRAANKTGLDRSAHMLDFDAPNETGIDLRGNESDVSHFDPTLDRKSVFLTGYGKKVDAQKILKLNDREVMEYTPIRASILFLTRDELIVYFADVDIIRGDVQADELNRVYLKEIVGASSFMRTKRLQRHENEELFEKFREIHGKQADELVFRENYFRISKTDGRDLEMPVGRPQLSDSGKGNLEEDDKLEQGVDTLVHKISQRIDDAKRATLKHERSGAGSAVGNENLFD